MRSIKSFAIVCTRMLQTVCIELSTGRMFEQCIVADDVGLNRKVMKRMLSHIDPTLSLFDFETGECVLHLVQSARWQTALSKQQGLTLFILDNDMGCGLQGTDVAKLIVQAIDSELANKVRIVLWTSSADCMECHDALNAIWCKPTQQPLSVLLENAITSGSLPAFERKTRCRTSSSSSCSSEADAVFKDHVQDSASADDSVSRCRAPDASAYTFVSAKHDLHASVDSSSLAFNSSKYARALDLLLNFRPFAAMMHRSTRPPLGRGFSWIVNPPAASRAS